MEVSTKAVIEEFIKYKNYSDNAKRISQMDRPEVYQYEEKLGKTIFHMNSEELFGMFMTFQNNSPKASPLKYQKPPSTAQHLVSTFRNLFDYYIWHYEVLLNPFDEPMWKGRAFTDRINAVSDKYTNEDFEELIAAIQKEYGGYLVCRANYYECILQLVYNGFFNTQEIALLNEEDIDFENKTIKIRGIETKVSDRCFELVEYVSNLKELPSRGMIVGMVKWENHWMPYPVRSLKLNPYQDYDLTEVGKSINRILTKNVKQEVGLPINLRTIFHLGFYNRLVKKHGEDEVKNMIQSYKNSHYTDMLKEEIALENIPNSFSNTRLELSRFL